MRPRLGIRGLLLAVNAFAFVIPVVAIVALRWYDDQLIRRTEAQLINQSVLIAELWRGALERELGAPLPLPRPSADDAPYFKVEPTLRLSDGVSPPEPETSERAVDRASPAWRAGQAIAPVLERARLTNLSSARVLDAHGCVVASSGAELGACFDGRQEVDSALGGAYASLLRRRQSEQPSPAFQSISRAGRVRVFVALPVRSGDRVLGVVRMARTALDPQKALYFDRDRLLATAVVCAVLIAALSLFVSRTLVRPLRAITQGARGIARGEGRAPFEASRFAPQELRDVSAALDQMTTQLSDRAAYIADFAANVSHELKTPITGIRGAAELLSEQWRDMSDKERERFLHNIEQDADRMERLVSRLLHLARIQSAPEAVEDVDPKAFLERLASGYGEPLRLTLGPLPDRLRIQPDHLESALRNLIENALRHGAGQPVDLEARAEGDRVRIRVRDRGTGISERNRERVFDRFFTTERERGGTGLGLAIARAVAETRGGRLEFETGPDGTCFDLWL